MKVLSAITKLDSFALYSLQSRTLATPHDGAPLAFARAIGVGGASLGLSEADFRRLSAAPGYPAAYQLFSPKRLEPIWDLEDSMPFKTRSLFDPVVLHAFDLDPDHLRAAAALHDSLDISRKPIECRYFAVVSAAHETVMRFNQDLGAADAVKVKSSGDGTVPILSAAALPIQTAFVEANHVGIVQKPVTHQILGMLLGRMPPAPVIAAAGAANVPNLSISQRSVAEGERVEVVVNLPELNELKAEVRIRRDQGGGRLDVVSTIPIVVQTPSLTRMEFLAPYLEMGRYELDLVIDNANIDREELLVSRTAP
jgi:hypothetical protein